MSGKPTRIVAIGIGSLFGRGLIADLLGSPQSREMDCTLVLVDRDAAALERMYRFALLLKEHSRSRVTVEMTRDRRQALAGAGYVVTSVAVRRYPLWEQDFRVPLAYGFKHVLGENGGPGAVFHALRNYELMMPICRDMEDLCPEALLLNYTNPESRIIRAVSDLTRIKAVGLCHGVFGARDGVCALLGRKPEDVDFISGGLNHFFWVTRVADKKTGRDLYPELRRRVLANPPGAWTPPLVRKMVEVFGLYTYPSDDHIGEYLSFAYEFGDGKWPYGQECRPVPPEEQPPDEHPLDAYLSGVRALDDWALARSGELAIPIVLAMELGQPYRAEAVNLPNAGGWVAELPRDAVVEVPAVVDGEGLHPQEIGPVPEALAAFMRTQCSIQKLLVQAYQERSRSLLLQALLLDPVVDSVARAEQLLQEMLELQQEYLPRFA